MKKLSVFIYSMAGGGAERVVSNLLKYLVNHFEIHLILQNEQIDYTLPKGVKIHLLENSKPFESGILKLAMRHIHNYVKNYLYLKARPVG